MIPIEVTIRRNEDGVERKYAMEWPHDDLAGLWYAFSDGNYACDYNRLRFFLEEEGKQPDFKHPDDGSWCNSIHYAVPSIVRTDTGEQVYADEPEMNE